MTSRRDLAASLLAVAAACPAATSAPGNAAPAAPLPASPAMPARTGSASPSVTPADAASAPPSPATSGAVVGSAAATSPITAATVLVAVDDGPATDRPAYARVDQCVVLYAALVATASATGARTLFTDAPRPKLTTRGLRGLPVAPL
ncbi:MAG: hypothetical protein H7287_09905, partial [Thermoleophilia bacterium]|nr:hypothetical protein [Thermoleophilia bacterium]